MAQKIFRALAGVLVVLYVWLMFKTQTSLSDKIVLSVFAAAFAVYALFGKAPFQRFAARMNGKNEQGPLQP
jgi:hypothetical protein